MIRLLLFIALLLVDMDADAAEPRAAAAEPDGPRWQIWIKRPGEDWTPQLYGKDRRPWFFSGETACNTDLPGQAKGEPDGTAIVCRRANPVAVRR